MCGERLPEEDFLAVLLIIQPYLFTMLLFLLFVVLLVVFLFTHLSVY